MTVHLQTLHLILPQRFTMEDPRPEELDIKAQETPSVQGSPKKPPPETPEGIRLRTLVIVSFWAVAVLLGLPTWLWTTSIHRARLPLREMLDWADGKVRTHYSSSTGSSLGDCQACKPTFPLQIAIEAPEIQEHDALNLVQITQHALDDLNEFSAHHLRLHLTNPPLSSSTQNASMPLLQESYQGAYSQHHNRLGGQAWPALTVRLHPLVGAQAARAELQTQSTILDIYHAPGQMPTTSASSSGLATFIATQLQDLFQEEQTMIANTLSQSSSGTQQTIGQNSINSHAVGIASRDPRPHALRSSNPGLATKVGRRMKRSLKYAPTYHITVSLFTPSSSPSSWEIESALAEYIAPLLDSLSGLSNFTVDTQVQLHATLSPSVQSPEYDTENQVWTLKDEDLSGFINAAEWPLSPSIGAGPTINFVIYVPAPTMSPLLVKGSQASSWLIPQWGGVVILNPQDLNNTTSSSTVTKEDLQEPLLTFSHQLLAFLGTPQTPMSLPLQLQTLIRVRTASLLLSASSTMGSLARLTEALPSIAIPETVSNAVDITLAHLHGTCISMKDGKFGAALEHARTAEAQAERGFFEKSMVGQVYFPDEHKVAVYLPLLGPVGVPLIMSGLKEFRRWWSARKATTVH